MKPSAWFNGSLPAWGRLIIAFIIGVGTAVAATFTTFETQTDHDNDLVRVEDLLKEVRQDVKVLLQRGQSPVGEACPEP